MLKKHFWCFILFRLLFWFTGYSYTLHFIQSSPTSKEFLLTLTKTQMSSFSLSQSFKTLNKFMQLLDIHSTTLGLYVEQETFKISSEKEELGKGKDTKS